MYSRSLPVRMDFTFLTSLLPAPLLREFAKTCIMCIVSATISNCLVNLFANERITLSQSEIQQIIYAYRTENPLETVNKWSLEYPYPTIDPTMRGKIIAMLPKEERCFNKNLTGLIRQISRPVL